MNLTICYSCRKYPLIVCQIKDFMLPVIEGLLFALLIGGIIGGCLAMLHNVGAF